jgi:hypothetical protein
VVLVVALATVVAAAQTYELNGGYPAASTVGQAYGKGWFVYFRIYGPEKFDGTWEPGDFEEVR